MSDEGEKTCPLCAEEMDLTDQQLKPCKCGYDICVWCWHHIMDMAEKDDTEGRCPACRTPYNKEKIVGTASKCERLVAEMSVEKKQKSQKGKSKPSEGRKQLSSVRVIQRNLVYIVGLPLNLADEDLLQRKEYFGQYGKVLKVSISRTASGSIQHFANSTCSVYITYSKEDEAVRSIQSVHGFVLEGRPLRACFGTTKYCHAWLRNMPCTNPDCLYLHEFGSQEDSFTKDEIISEYTRGRVQQVTGATNDVQRRSGSILPPVVEEYSNNNTSSWPKPISSKTTSNDTSNSMKGSSPPNSSSARSVALPAAAPWGTHASNSQPVVSSNGPSKQKVEISTSTTVSSSTVVTPLSNGNEVPKKGSEDISFPSVNGKDKVEHELPESSDTSPDDSDEFHKLSTDMSSLALQPSEDEKPFNSSNKPAGPTLENDVTRDMSYLIPDNKVEEEVEVSEVEADLLSFNDQRLMDPEVGTHTTSSYVQKNSCVGYSSQNHTLNMPVVASSSVVNGDSFLGGGYNGHSHFPGNGGSRNNHIGIFEDTVKRDNHIHSSNNRNNGSVDLGGEKSIISNILSMDFDPWDESLTSPRNLAKLLGNTTDKQQQQRKAQNSNQSRFSFAREEDETSSFSDFGRDLNPHSGYPGGQQLRDGNGFSCFNFEESERLAGSLSSFSSNKIPVSRSQISAPPGFIMGGPSSRAPPPGFTATERIIEPPQTYDHLSGNHMFDGCSLMRKANHHYQAAAAAVYNNNNGGVSELELMDPAILAIGGARLPTIDMMRSFPSQNHQHASYENDNSNRLRLLMQRSLTQQQKQRYTTDVGLGGDSYLARTDSYGRILEQAARSSSTYQQQHGNFQQPPPTRSSLTSNGGGHWGGDGWSEVHTQNGNDMAELLRNERLVGGGFNKYSSSYSMGGGGYEDPKFRMQQPSSANNRSFGI